MKEIDNRYCFYQTKKTLEEEDEDMSQILSRHERYEAARYLFRRA